MDGICQTNVDDDKSVEFVKTDKLFLSSNQPKSAFAHIKKKPEWQIY